MTLQRGHCALRANSAVVDYQLHQVDWQQKERIPTPTTKTWMTCLEVSECSPEAYSFQHFALAWVLSGWFHPT